MSFVADPLSQSSLLQLPNRFWIRRRLLSWFANNARDLPWRITRDPYAIWISEVMLQQTQATTVIPYYRKFLAALPTVEALAAARQGDVLHLWQGLGYYRRARDLHRAAQIIRDHHGGRIPDNPELLRTLPGFGRYTVNAVLSQAFERRLPILETNSVRVLCRLLGVRRDPRHASVQRRLWQAAAALLPLKRIGDFNQALMELGALICTPLRPNCHACPLEGRCHARLENLQMMIPRRPPKEKIERVAEVAVVLRKGKHVLLVRRPATGRWACMWEMPHAPLEDKEKRETAARRLLHSLGLRGQLAGEIAVIRHSITRFRITIGCLAAHYRGGRFRAGSYTECAWVEPSRLVHYPLSSPQRTLAKILMST